MRRHLCLVVLVPLLAGCVSFGLDMPANLKEHGVTAEAEIVDIWDTGWTVNDNPAIGMHVEVRPATGEPFRATIQRCVVSRIAVPRPGDVIQVRYDPADPSVVFVDVGTGNPYHDHFLRDSVEGSQLAPPPAEPAMHAGSSNIDDDYLALLENGYVPLGVSIVARGGDDPLLARRQGMEIHAAMVVLYGAGASLEPLPFHRTPGNSEESLLKRMPKLPEHAKLATYWARNTPWIFGLLGRDLNDADKKRLQRTDGIVAAIVPVGSPVAAAGIVQGDVIISVDGKPVRTSSDLSNSYIKSIAGKSVVVELLHDGAPKSVTVKLNPR